MSIELMFLAVSMNFCGFVYLDYMMVELFALFILTVAAAEYTIGLAKLVITFWIRGTIVVETFVGIATSTYLLICYVATQ